MSNLKQLRTRIKSVKSTQKITKAMQLVSASKMTKIKTQIANSNFYIEAINKMMSDICSMTSCELSIEEQKFFNTMPSKINLLIVMTSERGLCGMFNYSIIKQVKNDIKELTNKGEQIKLIIIGKKGYEALKRQYANYINSYFEFTKIHSENLILQVKEKIMCAVKNLEVSNCIIYFNKFKNAMTQIPTKQKILPIEKHQDYSVVANDYFEYEGKNLISNLINLYVHAKINYALLQNIVSEEGARMTAMENATNNANDLISKLVLKLNRSRQTIITTELIEIIAGAEAV
ncbi:ATP synthase F1 subunit gamma [Rickettsia prowazekii]|uniref:ATP synthase gamma chain n=2 Tax=Rickettsia prowazekii TaxID=782 RepID=ATPG_RICPR|nr:ATP synthase F1 subunit gamma [Rickettsia prowazekii]O50289.1 RecName: Full=ATP synthase gamma chain; AltName: Full=ATP synthase F1 sector gamma subunit; AltName: Full=F-ATPase gamma subunit [Rickettsia prowazekii str. Madrid E]EOB10275.1 ATP synthase gamma chain [Rickettsia prowazekii str. GvF12]AAB88552.1 putative F1-ATP synthase gamma subunit [Rickettsia prowazekii]ADE30366.1 ATP synthase gamma chain [Rickettsia prowazekii str. Rp22]AFE49597.1 F0F1 ATP synthase subunit gamma [Rickettsia 